MFYAVGITLWSATLYCDHKKDPSGGCRVCVCDRGDHLPPHLGMWMTSHGQCPRGGGACECPRVGVGGVFQFI